MWGDSTHFSKLMVIAAICRSKALRNFSSKYHSISSFSSFMPAPSFSEHVLSEILTMLLPASKHTFVVLRVIMTGLIRMVSLAGRTAGPCRMG